MYAMPSGMEEMPTDEQLEKLSAIADVPVEVLKNKLSKKDKGLYLSETSTQLRESRRNQGVGH